MKFGTVVGLSVLVLVEIPAWLIASAQTTHVPPNGDLFSWPIKAIILGVAAVPAILAGLAAKAIARRKR